MFEIDEIARIKDVRVKTRTSEWFDREMVELKKETNYFTNIKNSTLQIDKELFNAARNRTQSLISNNKNIWSKKT